MYLPFQWECFFLNNPTLHIQIYIHNIAFCKLACSKYMYKLQYALYILY